MKHNFTKVAAVAAIAIGALFAVPTAASAYTPPPAAHVSTTTPAPGATFTFSVEDGAFLAGESVSLSITGENATGASLGFVKFAVSTKALGTVSANAAGGLDPVKITLPSNATGKYTVLATSASNVGVSVTVTATAGSGVGDPDDGLAVTGADSDALLTLWLGGGALVLAGGGIAVASAVRRNRKQASAA